MDPSETDPTPIDPSALEPAASGASTPGPEPTAAGPSGMEPPAPSAVEPTTPGATPPMPAWTALPSRPATLDPPAGPPSGRRMGLGAAVATAALAAILSVAGTYGVLRLEVGGAGTQTAATPAATATGGTASTSPGAAIYTDFAASDAIVRVAANAKPWVVTIVGSGGGADPFSARGQTGGGSGVVVSADGLILTTDRVVAGATTFTVTLDGGREVAATLVKTDSQHGLAVLRADATGLTAADLAAAPALKVGQAVVAIGSPLETFTDTVTLGIVSALDRELDVRDPTTGAPIKLSGLIQTDAAINTGSSGGPLLDVGGRLVGIITLEASGAQGVGFAVPIVDAQTLLASVSR
jgi:S1-C subfamily serine protease